MQENEGKIVNITGKIISYFEGDSIPFINYIITFVFLVLFRNFIELYATGQDQQLFQVLDYSPLYFALLVWNIFLFCVLTGEKVKAVAKVVIASFVLILIPPVLDVIISWGGQVRMGCIEVVDLRSLFISYFTILFDFRNNSNSIGQRIEIIVACVLSFVYVYYKTRKIWKSLMGSILIYTGIFIFGIFNFMAELPARWMNLQRVADPLFSEKYFFIFTLIILSILFYLYNKKYFKAMLKDFRFDRLIHFFTLLILGFVLSVSTKNNEFPIITSENIFYFVLVPISIIFSAIFSIITNNIYDVEIDACNKLDRPLINGSILIKPYLRLGWISLVIALIASGLVNRTCFILIALIIGFYFVYSCPPFRLKRFVIFSKFLVGINSFLITLLGFSIFGSPVLTFPKDYMFFILIPFALAGSFIDIKDYMGDKVAGIKTLPVILGLRSSKILIAFFTVASYANVIYLLSKLEVNWWILYAPMLLCAIHIFMVLKTKFNEKYVFAVYIFGLVSLIIVLLYH
jgi:4-hydroxybenzoate polyprenyltransferase